MRTFQMSDPLMACSAPPAWGEGGGVKILEKSLLGGGGGGGTEIFILVEGEGGSRNIL